MNPILITGAARSGTSLIAGIISKSGAFGGVMNGQDGLKSEFENYEIRQILTKTYFRTLKCDPMGQNPLPDLTNPEIMRRLILDGYKWWGMKVEGVLQRQGYIEGPWFYKGAEMCLVWPLWNGAFPKAKWIIVRRDVDAIAKSCLHTGFMTAFKTMDGWRAWVAVHKQRFVEIKNSCSQVKEIWPQDIINGDLTQVKEMLDWVELPYDEQKIKECILPELWKEGRNGK